MCIDVGTSTDVRIDMHVELCIDMRTGVFIDLCVDIDVRMCIDVRNAMDVAKRIEHRRAVRDFVWRERVYMRRHRIPNGR